MVLSKESNVNNGSLNGADTSTNGVEISANDKFFNYLAELRMKRETIGQEHKEHIRKHPPKLPGLDGSREVYDLSIKITTAIEVGQMLGLVDPDTDPVSYL